MYYENTAILRDYHQFLLRLWHRTAPNLSNDISDAEFEKALEISSLIAHRAARISCYKA